MPSRSITVVRLKLLHYTIKNIQDDSAPRVKLFEVPTARIVFGCKHKDNRYSTSLVGEPAIQDVFPSEEMDSREDLFYLRGGVLVLIEVQAIH